MSLIAYTGADIFDGTIRHFGAALLVDDGMIIGIGDVPKTARIHALNGGVIAPGFVDLQVNGGGGVLFNDEQSVAALRRIAQAHAKLGTTAFLPTLITDTPVRVAAAIEAVVHAIDQGVAGIIGLHIEGPHLSVARKGAHDAALIRPMQDADLTLLLDAAKRLPHLMVTVAPESVTTAQIKTLVRAGVVVSLGHTDADYDACKAASAAGASCVTHLFNAMSQLAGRAPGLVGAALETDTLHAGLIADGIHVSAASIRIALQAKQGPAAVFLVTDAMATAGSDITEFSLNGRMIYRRNGRLTLQDGTLAGADLDMPTALRFMVETVGLPVDAALTMATSAPAQVIRTKAVGGLNIGAAANFVHLNAGLELQSVWQDGKIIPPKT
ncbi:N-acetylglucosamine-6-phosphate deacetylase [Marinosulfonomonas sp. PRT-SC04]|nr:N-acetylglucosamine-6-phosphate deacetylase [Marinosulfonomonas sp. PRT-SC04]